MKQGKIHIFCGDGHGKSPAAIGSAIQSASQGKEVVIIQFLKGRGEQEDEFLKRLEPEIKIFRFEKSEANFEALTQEEKEEEIINIKNGINFAKKVLTTGECDLLILDEVLGLVDNGIITIDDLRKILQFKSDESIVIMTGIQAAAELLELADEVSRIETVKELGVIVGNDN